jgi:Arc/MetJ family transcription regulator
MRTTLTIDDDVVAELQRLRRTRDASLRDVVNDALHIWLRWPPNTD